MVFFPQPQGLNDMAKLKAGTPGKTFAINWNLNVTQSWNKALQIGAEEKLTDREILGLMKREFPHRGKFQSVSRIRWQYNRANMGFGLGEPLHGDDPRFLVQFDDDGQPVLDNKGGRPRKGEELKPLQTQVVATVEDQPEPPEDQDEPEADSDPSADFDLSDYSIAKLVDAAKAVDLDVSHCQDRGQLEQALRQRMQEEESESDFASTYDPGAVVLMLTKLHSARESLQTLLECGGPDSYLSHVADAESEMRKAQAVLIMSAGNGSNIPTFLIPEEVEQC